MLPRIASLPSLSARPLVRNHHGRDTPNGHKRRSMDRPRSSQDLISLDGLHVVQSSNSRSTTPALLAALPEAHSYDELVESYADEALAYINSLGCLPAMDAAAVEEPSMTAPPWLACAPGAGLDPVVMQDQPHTPTPEAEPVPVLAVQQQQEDTKEQQQAPGPQLVVRIPSGSLDGSLPRTPAAEAAPGEVYVYRAALSFTYVQELLGNLSHVQHMFKGMAANTSTTAAAAAMAAARMLSRSLARAGTRVKSTVKDASRVMLAQEAMFTLKEFGWAEVVTLDAEEAGKLGSLEMEVHNLPAGRMATYHRPNTNEPWVLIGSASTSVSSVRDTLGGAITCALLAAANAVGLLYDVSDPAGGAASPPGSPPSLRGLLQEGSVLTTRRGHPMSVADMVDQLQAASQSVSAAAGLLQQWLDEQKAALASAGECVAGGSSSSMGQPVMVGAGAV